MALAFNGTLEGSPPMDVAFSELPTLLFLSICLVITLRWAEIYHYQLKRSKEHPIRKVESPTIQRLQFGSAPVGCSAAQHFDVPHFHRNHCSLFRAPIETKDRLRHARRRSKRDITGRHCGFLVQSRARWCLSSNGECCFILRNFYFQANGCAFTRG